MTNREKQRELFVELINEQLKEHGVTYEDVKSNPSWYMEYKTTSEKEEAFIKYAVNRIKEVLKISKSAAEKEASWFILQWGLTIINPKKTLGRVKSEVSKRTES